MMSYWVWWEDVVYWIWKYSQYYISIKSWMKLTCSLVLASLLPLWWNLTQIKHWTSQTFAHTMCLFPHMWQFNVYFVFLIHFVQHRYSRRISLLRNCLNGRATEVDYNYHDAQRDLHRWFMDSPTFGVGLVSLDAEFVFSLHTLAPLKKQPKY